MATCVVCGARTARQNYRYCRYHWSPSGTRRRAVSKPKQPQAKTSGAKGKPRPARIGTCASCSEPSQELLTADACAACNRVEDAKRALAQAESSLKEAVAAEEERQRRLKDDVVRLSQELARVDGRLQRERELLLVLERKIVCAQQLARIRREIATLRAEQESNDAEIAELARRRGIVERLVHGAPNPNAARSRVSLLKQQNDEHETRLGALTKRLELAKTIAEEVQGSKNSIVGLEQARMSLVSALATQADAAQASGLEAWKTFTDEKRAALAKAERLVRERTARRVAKEAKEEAIRAAAGAYHGRIREDAEKVKPKLDRGHNCPFCDGPLGDNPHAEHLLPVSLGGFSIRQNMVYVCADCNLSKGACTVLEFCNRRGYNFLVVAARLAKLGKRV